MSETKEVTQSVRREELLHKYKLLGKLFLLSGIAIP